MFEFETRAQFLFNSIHVNEVFSGILLRRATGVVEGFCVKLREDVMKSLKISCSVVVPFLSATLNRYIISYPSNLEVDLQFDYALT